MPEIMTTAPLPATCFHLATMAEALKQLDLSPLLRPLFCAHHFDLSLTIGPAYQVTTVVTKDGRNLTGLIAEDNEHRIVIRMIGEGEESIPRNNVKYTRVSKLSMMPEGVEELLEKKDLADLFAFLCLDKPPDDPTARPIPGAPPIPQRQ